MDTLTLPQMPKNLLCLFDQNYGLFTFQKLENEKVTAKCKLCPNKIIVAQVNVSSNFNSHLKIAHPEEFEKFKKEKPQNKGCGKNKFKDEKGPSLDVFKIGETCGKQEKADRLITQFLVTTMSPVSIVRHPAFKTLVMGLSVLNYEAKVKPYEVFHSRILNSHLELKNQIKSSLSKVDYLCVTADRWSTKTRRFVGMTVHWINNHLERKSAILRFCRLEGVHSYDRLALSLSSTFQDYGLTIGKILGVVTDNGSNYVKAFEIYEISDHEIEENNMDDEDGNREEEESNVIRISDILNEVPQEEQDIVLPKHFRCAAHKLNLVASKEPDNIADKKVLRAALSKCNALWIKNSSPKQAENVFEILNARLIRPVTTRWNSLYDSINRLLKHRDKINIVCQKLEVPIFREAELESLESYKICLSPISSALDILQGEKDAFMAHLFPELLRIERKLTELTELPGSEMTNQIARSLKKGINQRNRYGWLLDFGPESEECIIASISHPLFKLRWIPKERVSASKALFVAEVKKCYVKKSNPNDAICEIAKRSKMEERYNFGTPESHNESDNRDEDEHGAETECLQYFSDNRVDLDMLFSYSTVKNVFVRFNTVLPSSAPVERLFSYGGLILRKNRLNMKDDLFEALAMLKCNETI